MLTFGCDTNQDSLDAVSTDKEDLNNLVNEICGTDFQLKWGNASIDYLQRQIEIIENKSEIIDSICLDNLKVYVEYKELWIGDQSVRKGFLNKLLINKSKLTGEYHDIILVETSHSGEIHTAKNYLFLLVNQDSKMFTFSSSYGGWVMSNSYQCDQNKIIEFFNSLNRDPDCDLLGFFEGVKIFTRLSKNGNIVSRVMLGLTKEEEAAFHDAY